MLGLIQVGDGGNPKWAAHYSNSAEFVQKIIDIDFHRAYLRYKDSIIMHCEPHIIILIMVIGVCRTERAECHQLNPGSISGPTKNGKFCSALKSLFTFNDSGDPLKLVGLPNESVVYGVFTDCGCTSLTNPTGSRS